MFYSFVKTKQNYLEYLEPNYNTIYLRHYYIKLYNKDISNYIIYNEIKEVVTDSMLNGKYLCINFDECLDEEYKYDYDVNLREFYGKNMLSPFMFNPNLFFQLNCWTSHLGTSKKEMQNENFKYFLYSKMIINSSLGENEIINLIEKRYSFSLPLENLQICIIDNST